MPPRPAPVPRRLVVGCGNVLRGDDAAGPTLVRRLEARGLPAGVRCFDAATDGLAVVEAMRGVPEVIVVDACSSGAAPGTVVELDGSAVEAAPPAGVSVHAVRWSEALALARVLLGDAHPRRVTAWLVEGASFEPGAELAPEVSAAVDRLVERVAGADRPPGPGGG